MSASRKTAHSLKGHLAAVGVAIVAAGCSTQTSFLNYSEHNLYSSANAGNMPYVEIGPVTARESGFVWESCAQLFAGALEQASENAERHGANALIGIRWLNHAEGTWHDTPRCTTQWGWFAAAGVGGLAPWVKVAEFEGKLAFFDEQMIDNMKAGKADYEAFLTKQALQRSEEQAAMEEAEQQSAASNDAEAG